MPEFRTRSRADGDGKTDRAVFRPSTGTWWVYKSSTSTYTATNWGNWADQPVIGDFNNDNKADLAVWRPSSGVWYVDHTDASTFEYHTLGNAGDFAGNSAYIKQVGGSVSSDELSLARLAPRNATGGTNLYSQNFGWGTSLVSLPGRSGLDLNIGLSYNSLVWTKQGSSVYFDTDYANVTPGFNLGFPTVEQAFYDSSLGKWNFLMITPSGGRVHFRQTAVSSVYETFDSSYLQLKMDPADAPDDPPSDIAFEVYGTDGTKMSYSWSAGAYQCTKITDRNGNYLSMAYNDWGFLETATDTLGRVVTVNYDAQYYPTSITQTWKADNGAGSNTTHTWATFTYTTLQISTDFDGVTVVGPPNGTYIKVLEKVTYPDTSWTKFLYNGYGQVKKIENYADDDHLLNYTRTNLDSVAADQTDCPRFTSTAMKAENFNLSGGAGTEQEVVVTNTAPTSDSTTLPGSLSVSGKIVDVGVTGHPDGLYSRTYFADSGWQEGLTLATQDCTGTDCATVKRWTWTQWEQDQVGLTEHPYQRNPRVIETRVGDGTNTKRTTISYLEPDNPPMNTDISLYGLPNLVQVYASDLSTVIKKSEITYKLTSTYTDRRILGLPLETKSWGWNDLTSSLEYVSRSTFEYDYDDDFAVSGMDQDISPVQHDSTNYGATFSAGRGNMTKAIRWDVTDDDDPYDAVETQTLYNTAGSVVARITPWDGTNTRTVKIGYADSWNSTGNPTTYAYPTTITDPADNASTVKYRYDIGANVEAESPAPAGWDYGKRTVRTFDSIGRLQKNAVWWNPTESAWVEQSYVRYEYPTNGIHSKVFSTLVDTNSNGPDSNDEVLSESWFDGAGRVRMSRVPHTFSSGTPATWAGTLTEYDILGRVYRTSVPTEVDNSFAATGDDYTRGFLWNYAEYDWMGRTTRTIPTDSNGSDGKDTLISYEGCGCAGGLVATVQGPLVPRDDDPQTNARRMQKSWADILGRTWKTQTFDWDEDPYLTTEIRFNGRDQTIKVEQTDEEATVTQTSTATFDGHGRLYQSHRPEQRDSSNNLKYTTYSYNPDDSILSVTDGRGAVTNLTYNSRGLLTTKGWTVPGGSGIADPTDVTFSYDDLGNRTQMTDGMGVVNYTYDSLSRLTSETRDFTDDLTDGPNSGLFTLSYEYTLTGLKSYTDPYGAEIEYAHQKDGRLSAVTGSSFGGVTTYANNPGYRAWGSLKHLEYGSGQELDITYNSRLLPATVKVDDPTDGSAAVFDKSYEYHPDGALRLIDETSHTYMDRFDRAFTYDHAQRIRFALSGSEAHGTTESDLTKLPYRQYQHFNAFDQLTDRSSNLWSLTGWDFANIFQNNRSTGGIYDNNGSLIEDEEIEFEYDASGSMLKTRRDLRYETVLSRDGEGHEAKRSTREWDEPNDEEGSWESWKTRYFIYSSVFGRIVTEASETGKKRKTYVLSGGGVIARQGIDEGTTTENVAWEHTDPSGFTVRNSGVASGETNSTEERDALGNNVGTLSPISSINKPALSGGASDPFTSIDSGFKEVDGVLMPASLLGSNAIIVSQVNVDGTLTPRPLDFSRHLPGGGVRVYIPGRYWETDPEPSDDPSAITIGSWGYWPGRFITLGNFQNSCHAAILGVVRKGQEEHAKVAVPLLDAVTGQATGIGGYNWGEFAYLLATVEHESRFGAPHPRLHWSPQCTKTGVRATLVVDNQITRGLALLGTLCKGMDIFFAEEGMCS